MNTDTVQGVALNLGANLLIGLTAGIGANYYLNRGPLHLYAFVLIIYPMLLVMVLLTRRFMEWPEDKTNDETEKPTRQQYAS